MRYVVCLLIDILTGASAFSKLVISFLYLSAEQPSSIHSTCSLCSTEQDGLWQLNMFLPATEPWKVWNKVLISPFWGVIQSISDGNQFLEIETAQWKMAALRIAVWFVLCIPAHHLFFFLFWHDLSKIIQSADPHSCSVQIKLSISQILNSSSPWTSLPGERIKALHTNDLLWFQLYSLSLLRKREDDQMKRHIWWQKNIDGNKCKMWPCS